MFDASNLDEDTVLALLDAATNPDIARLLDTDWFRGILESAQELPAAEPEIRKAIRRLTARLRDWKMFEEALSNPDGDFASAIQFMKEIGSEEKSFGIWLSCMTTYEEFLSTIQNGPPLEHNFASVLWDAVLTDVSHADFLGFVKAYIGVACVLAVYAWSDSLPNVYCRERTLGVLRLWQDVPGYREVRAYMCVLVPHPSTDLVRADRQPPPSIAPNDFPSGMHDNG